MRNVVWFVLLFAAAVIAAAGLSQNDGLVSIFLNDTRLDVSRTISVTGAGSRSAARSSGNEKYSMPWYRALSR